VGRSNKDPAVAGATVVAPLTLSKKKGEGPDERNDDPVAARVGGNAAAAAAVVWKPRNVAETERILLCNVRNIRKVRGVEEDGRPITSTTAARPPFQKIESTTNFIRYYGSGTEEVSSTANNEQFLPLYAAEQPAKLSEPYF